MSDLVSAIPDMFIVIGALVFSLKCFGFSRSLRGYLGRNFVVVGIASLLFFLAEIVNLVSDVGLYPQDQFLHAVMEGFFVVVLAVGVSGFFPSWMPKGDARAKIASAPIVKQHE